ncbi:hypothetical protein HFO62_30115 [Rhizobium leguminosarum]|nr:hypothetical protein [Rhizobium leguminosarum]
MGSGPAGATAARLLAHAGRPVVLIDPGETTMARLEVLSPSAIGVVHALQLEQTLLDPAIARPCAGIRRRWASQDQEFDDFLCRPGGQGFVVDRAPFDARLREMALAAGAVAVDGRLLDVRHDQDRFELTIRSAAATTRLSALLVVDASGRPAVAACRLGAERILSERLIAKRESLDQSGAASQEAVWLDVEGRCGMWSYSTLGPDGRRERWSVHRGESRRRARDHVVNASAACLTRAAGNGWIAIGDAAVAFDPIASQGLANALSSAIVSAGAIAYEGNITPRVASDYSASISTTFEYSEHERSKVYRAMRRN